MKGRCGIIKSKLPVCYPMITTYTQHAHLLTILTGNEFTYDWIFSNYIQLYINKDYEHNWGDFYFPFPYELRPSDTCKWIISKKIGKDLILKKWRTIIDFVIDSIDMGNYIHTMINNFYIPLSQAYKKYNYRHDIFIYGYNTKERILYVSDFFATGKYSFEEISFTDFEKAYSADHLAANSDYLNGLVYLYSLNKECDYKFDINNIISSLKAYYNCNTPEYWLMYNNENIGNIVFGNQIYTTLSNYISKAINGNADIDLRPFYLLYDHKKIMLLRIKYLNQKGYFSECYEKSINDLTIIEEQCRLLVSLVIKYNITKNTKLINKAINVLNLVKNQENDILLQYIS